LAFIEKEDAAFKAWNDERVRRENAAAADQVRQRVAASHERFDSFMKKNGVEAWPPLDQFKANPFVYEGKIVGLISSCVQMIGRDRGIFEGGILVSSVPTDACQVDIKILLAGRVQGNELVETPFGGKVPVPHLNLVDFYRCQQNQLRYCEDVFFWQYPH
jgi:hypothetical protein